MPRDTSSKASTPWVPKAFLQGFQPTELHLYSLRDVLRGVRAAWKTIEARSAISLPGLGEAVPIRSARAAVIVALKALGLPPGSRIGVPLYCCPVVFKAIKAADCAPRFLDIDPGTFCLSLEDLKAKSPGMDAVIAVHMFGNPCDMPKVLALMNGKPVVEDCAQSLGSRLGGRACGSFGDIAIFSFRSGKYLSVGEGGALYTSRADLHARLSEKAEALPVPPRVEELKHIGAVYIRSKLRSRPWWGLIGARIWAAYNKKTEFADKSPIVVGRMFASDMATLRRRMPRLDALILSQRAHADYYEHHLDLGRDQLCPERPQDYANRFMYPLVFPSTAERDRMAVFLRSRGIGTSKPYEEVIAGAAKHYGYEGDCPLAERALRRTLVIPSFSALKPGDIERIVRAANQGYRMIDRDRRTRP